MVVWTRRSILASGISALAAAASANVETSVRPRSRPLIPIDPVSNSRPRSRPDTHSLIDEARLGGEIGFVVSDVASGEILEAVDGDTQLPPASVAKAVTSLYALETLGANYQFKTRLIAEGGISDGILDGDLIVVGGGDPHLFTDDIAALAEMLEETGIHTVTGDLKVWGGALRGAEEIDKSQMDHLGYNPSLSGLNLNFNRVHFEWKRDGEDYSVTMDARSATHRADVTVAKMQVVERRSPIYTFADGGDVDNWTVARGALGNEGSRWLPVREPELYVGDVFRTFAKTKGIDLRPAVKAQEEPKGTTLATLVSEPLQDISKDMLKYSTNLTAEVTGITASDRRAGVRQSLGVSAYSMSRWCGSKADVSPSFVDHSGLGDQSRISAAEMVALLVANGAKNTLFPVLKEFRLVDADQQIIPESEGYVRAKTGTLNFVSALAGYIETKNGQSLAFAFFSANLAAREAGKESQDETPTGARTFSNRARKLQRQLLKQWIKYDEA